LTVNQSNLVHLKRFVSWGLSVSAIVAWIGLASFLSEPLDSFTTRRWALASIQLMAALGLSWFAMRLRRDQDFIQKFLGWLNSQMQKRLAFYLTLIFAGLIAAIAWVGLFLPEERAIEMLGSLALYLPRLANLLTLSFSLSLAVIGSTMLARHGWMRRGAVENSLIRMSAKVLGVLLFGWLLIAITGIGSGIGQSDWNAPGAPIQFSQVVFAILITVITSRLIVRFKNNRLLDLVLFFLIWVLAAWLWNSFAVAPTYYSSIAYPPSEQIYPLSDAFNHDAIANNVLVGEGFRFVGLEAIRKPLYVAFLAILHWLSGSDYAGIVQLQVVVLALFPAALYLLGRELHSRGAGIGLAALVIFRESNSLQLGELINLSHAKLLMADFPAALGLGIYCLLVVVWLKRRRDQAHWALIGGGMLGFLLLLRSQHLTVIAGMGLFLLVAAKSFKWNWRTMVNVVALFILGIVLTAAPWILRNRASTGEWIIEHSIAISFLVRGYQPEGEMTSRDFLPGESEGEYYSRFSKLLVEDWRASPIENSIAVGDYYVRNLILTVGSLPLTWELWDLESHITEQQLWPQWDGSLTDVGSVLMFGNLAILAIGIAGLWKRWGWLGLVPLIVLLAFTLNLALSQVSGWRYNQPVDWIVLLYFMMGLAEMARFMFGRLGLASRLGLTSAQPLDEADTLGQLNFDARKIGMTLLGLLLLGNSLIMAERLIKPRYVGVLSAQVISILDSNLSNDSNKIAEDLESGQLIAFEGRALYPRFLKANQGERGRDFALVSRQDFDRLTFFMVGPRPLLVVLPIDQIESGWQSGLDVVVLACRKDLSQTKAVLVFNHQGELAQEYFAQSDMDCP
jgi:hypothetical protein